MKRVLGCMLPCEVEKKKRYKCRNGLEITIEAGPHGWTVIYADYSTNYENVDDTTENNFQKAYNFAVKDLGKLTEISNKGCIKEQ